MHDRRANSLLSSAVIALLLLSGCAGAVVSPRQDALPGWISRPKLEDAIFHYIVCSHDGLDPEEARLKAEGKCLASAAKLGGVNITLRHKTVQSLSGTDSAEVAEVEPTRRFVRCNFTDRHLESLGTGYRLWLMCRVPKGSVERQAATPPIRSTADAAAGLGLTAYKRAVAYVTTVPQAEKLVVSGERGERVIDVSSNPQSVEIREGDLKVTARKAAYRESSVDLGDWENATTLSKTVYLEREF
jgi:hypothetical protein